LQISLPGNAGNQPEAKLLQAYGVLRKCRTKSCKKALRRISMHEFNITRVKSLSELFGKCIGRLYEEKNHQATQLVYPHSFSLPVYSGIAGLSGCSAHP
jgi:hypothetical protein